MTIEIDEFSKYLEERADERIQEFKSRPCEFCKKDGTVSYYRKTTREEVLIELTIKTSWSTTFIERRYLKNFWRLCSACRADWHRTLETKLYSSVQSTFKDMALRLLTAKDRLGCAMAYAAAREAACLWIHTKGNETALKQQALNRKQYLENRIVQIKAGTKTPELPPEWGMFDLQDDDHE